MTERAFREERIGRRLRALMFAALDTNMVVTAAEFLAGPTAEPLAGRFRRVAEAGLVVVYARPFVHTRDAETPAVGPPKYESDDMRDLHEETLEQRHKVYAHTGDTDFRVMVDLGYPGWVDAFLETGGNDFVETWSPPNADLLHAIAALAAYNRDHFVSEVEEVHKALASMRDSGG